MLLVRRSRCLSLCRRRPALKAGGKTKKKKGGPPGTDAIVPLEVPTRSVDGFVSSNEMCWIESSMVKHSG